MGRTTFLLLAVAYYILTIIIVIIVLNLINRKEKNKLKKSKKKNKEFFVDFHIKGKKRKKMKYLNTLKDSEFDERKVVMSSLLSEITISKDDILVAFDDVYFYNSKYG